MPMRIGPEGLAIVKASEGLRLKAYRDTGGVWTIGWGHTRTAREGMEIPAEKAVELLRSDLVEAEQGVSRAIGRAPTSQSQFDAMVSLAFNIGIGAFRTSTVRRWAPRLSPSSACRSVETRT